MPIWDLKLARFTLGERESGLADVDVRVDVVEGGEPEPQVQSAESNRWRRAFQGQIHEITPFATLVGIGVGSTHKGGKDISAKPRREPIASRSNVAEKNFNSDLLVTALARTRTGRNQCEPSPTHV